MSGRQLTAEELAAMARGEDIAGDTSSALDQYASIHQGVASAASGAGFGPIVDLVNMAWEPLTGRAGSAAEQKKRDIAAAKKKADAATAQANYGPAQIAAQGVATSEARQAAGAQQAADAAKVKASTEADPHGPLHATADRAQKLADLYAASAQASAAKAAPLTAALPANVAAAKAKADADAKVAAAAKAAKMPLWEIVALGLGISMALVGLVLSVRALARANS